MIVLLLVAAGAGAQESGESRFGARTRVWIAEMRGDIQSDSSALPGTEDIVLGSELGVEGHDVDYELRIFIDLPRIGRFAAAAWFASASGENDVPIAFAYSGDTYAAGEHVETSVRVGAYDLFWERAIFSAPFADVGPLVGVRYVTLAEGMESALHDAEEHGRQLSPLLGVRAEFRFARWLGARVEVLGFNLKPFGIELSTIGASLEVLAHPIASLTIGLGYRFERLDLDDKRGSTTVEGELTLTGLFFTLGGAF